MIFFTFNHNLKKKVACFHNEAHNEVQISELFLLNLFELKSLASIYLNPLYGRNVDVA